MQLSQIPTMVPLPFAENGTKNTIPEASQIGVTPGAASLNDGFPPLTFTPLAAGGIPPAGADFNGILNLLSANTQWQNAGGFFQYNAAFSTTIGGYPKTALLAQASDNGYWLNLEDNNTSDPDTGGAGWLAFDPWAIQSAQYITASDTGAVNAYAVALNPAPAALTTGMLVSIKSISNTNTGAVTLAVNGLSTLPILLSQNTPLSGGELVAGYGAIVRLNNAGTAWELIWTGAGSFGIAATQSNAAVVLSQITNSSLSPTFGNTNINGTLNATGAMSVGGLASFDYDIGAQSFTYNSQGLTVGWNFTNGDGEVDLLLGPSGALGGLNIYQLNSSGNMVSTTPILALAPNGNLSVAGTASAAAATSGNEVVNLGQLFIGNRKAVFTSNGTYTVPAGVTQIWVSGVGGGGGGGSGGTSSATAGAGGGGGGGAGQPSIKQKIVVAPGDTLSIAIGAAGVGAAAPAAVASTNGNAGTSGAATTLTDTTTSTTLLTLTGGGGGSSGGGGGGSSGGGGSGGGGYPSGGFGGDGNYAGYGGAGASGPFGGGGESPRGATASPQSYPGQAAYGYGSGGSGGAAIYTATSVVAGGAGGNGAPGFLSIEW